jgi:hypothetical protein
VLEVLEGRNENAAFLVLEADTGTLVQAIKVAHRCDDGVCRVMGGDHNAHGETSAVLAVLAFGQEKFKCDMLLLLGP